METDEPDIKIHPFEASVRFEKMMKCWHLEHPDDGKKKPKSGGRKSPKRKDERFGE